MRTLGNLDHPRLKITLMHHGRYLLKLEDRDVELTYKFRDGEGIRDIASAKRMLDLGLLQEAERTLLDMAAARARYRVEPKANPDEEFPVII